ncbi:MAG: type II toxin-antitoxin system ParD family antitoxin [Acidobacteriota bacterium]
MTVTIPTELESFVQAMIETGQYQDRNEVVGQALRLLRDLDARHRQLGLDILEGVHSGPSIPAQEVFTKLEKRAQIDSQNESGS